jgi:hypothetical protein
MTDKSVLEDYVNAEAKKRRAPTSKEMEQDAIEPDTTLEGLLIGPGRAAAGAIAKGVNRFVNKSAPRVTAPKIGSEVPDSSNRIRNLFDPDPPFPILSPSQRAKKEILKNKQALVDSVTDSIEVGTRRAAGELAAEANTRYKKANQEASKYAKGGKVSSASKRADGCAQRGKTKGRYL